VDSAALMENASRLPQGLDNCFAVTHTDHSTTTTKSFFSFYKGEKKMLKKSLFEELIMTITKEDLARLLGAAEGFQIDAIWDKQTNVVFSLIRQTDFNEECASPLEPGDFCERGTKE
jgi:hypothetical protein